MTERLRDTANPPLDDEVAPSAPESSSAAVRVTASGRTAVGGGPVILLTFANDRAGGGEGYLRALAEEQRRIEAALAPLDGPFEIEVRTNTRIDDLYRLMARFNDRIVVFHYGGHARPDALMFEDDEDGPAEGRIAGIAARLGDLPRLALVFLNGCGTAAQVDVIRAHVRCPVIATDHAIVDEVARDFAHRFYDDLSEGRSIAEAFRGAESRIRATVPDRAGAVRMLRPAAAPTTDWPWALHVHPDRTAGAAWRLRDALASPTPPTSPRWFLRGAVLGAVLAALVVLGLLLRPSSAPEPVVADASRVPAPVAVDAGAPDARRPDPLASPAADRVFAHLLERVRAGEPRAVVAASVTDAHRWTLWALVSLPWDRPGAAPMQRALVEEGLRRLAERRPEPSVAQLGRVGRLYRGIDMLRRDRRAPLDPAEAAALDRRVGEAIRTIWPIPGDGDPAALRGTMVPVAELDVALGQTEVTLGQMRALIPGFAPDRDPREPVDRVDWFVARAFAGWLGARLPTRAEFDALHAWVDVGGRCRPTDDGLDGIAWHRGNSDRVMPVGLKGPCGGLYDLRGNVSEWALDPEPRHAGTALAYGGRFNRPASVVGGRHINRAAPDLRSSGYGLRLAVGPERVVDPSLR